MAVLAYLVVPPEALPDETGFDEDGLEQSPADASGEEADEDGLCVKCGNALQGSTPVQCKLCLVWLHRR